MGELWWAEAVIAIDREPNWQHARATVDGFRPDDIPHWDEYVNELDEAMLAAVDPAAATALSASASPERDARLLPHVLDALRRDVDEVAEVLRCGRAYVCAFAAAGFRVYVHCSGYGPEPDRLCDAWLRVHNAGLLRAAGFVDTFVLEGDR